MTATIPQALSYADALATLDRLDCSAMKLGLSRMNRALAQMGNPHQALRVIHIAGSNGKGSTAAMLTRILMAAGLRVGTFISPHLWDARERIAINDHPISCADFCQEVAVLRQTLASVPAPDWPTYFEFLALMAFQHFRRANVDIVALETGLGGRLDATNVVPSPLATVITTISLEHQALLGDTLAAIAAEKAGILKHGAPMIVGPALPQEALEVIEARARALASPITLTDADRLRILPELTTTASAEAVDSPNATNRAPRLTLLDARNGERYSLALCAPYQRDNAATALTVIDVLRNNGLRIPPAAVAQGLEACRWPARFEYFESHQWIVDGSHNAEGFASLQESLSRWMPNVPIIMVVSLRANRDPAALEALLAQGQTQAVVTTSGPQAHLYHTPSALAQALRSLHPALAVYEACEPGEALAQAHRLQRRIPGAWALATGSLYTAGALRQALDGSTLLKEVQNS